MKRTVASFVLCVAAGVTGVATAGFFGPSAPALRDSAPPVIGALCRLTIVYSTADPREVAIISEATSNPIARCGAQEDRTAVASALQQMGGAP